MNLIVALGFCCEEYKNLAARVAIKSLSTIPGHLDYRDVLSLRSLQIVATIQLSR
jgi:hypothetical protein